MHSFPIQNLPCRTTPPLKKDRNLDYYDANAYRNENRGGVLMMVKSVLNATHYSSA